VLELSFIDRLVNTAEARRPKSTWEQDRELRASLCRDLTDLLNTRRSERDVDPIFDEATQSLLTYGIPDFTQFDLKNVVELERLRISIDRAIKKFEPRLTSVRVIAEPPSPVNPILRFKIEATLRDDTDREDLIFDASVIRDSRRINVSGAAA